MMSHNTRFFFYLGIKNDNIFYERCYFFHDYHAKRTQTNCNAKNVTFITKAKLITGRVKYVITLFYFRNKSFLELKIIT